MRVVLVLMFALLTSVGAYATSYDIYVGGIQIIDENASDVFGDGTVSYDVDTSTLTLSDAHIDGAYEYDPGTGNFAGIYTQDFINIVVKGENTLNASASNVSCITGIYCYNTSDADKAIVIQGNSLEDSLVISCDDADVISMGISAHYGEMEFKNVSVEVNSGTCGMRSFGVICGDGVTCGSIVVDGASVIVNAGNVIIPDENAMAAMSYGVAAYDITVKNSAYLRAVGGDANSTSGITSIGLYGINSITVSDCSKIDAKGGGTGEMTGTETIPETVSFVSVGVQCDGNIDVKGKSVFNGRAGDVWTYEDIVATCKTVGILCQGVLTVEDYSYIYGRGHDANTEVLGISATEIVMADSELRGVGQSRTGGSVECIGIDVSAEILNATAVNSNDGIEEFVEDVGYDLPYLCVYSNYEGITRYGIFVGGVELTSENCDDVFGDGTVSFDPETVTLSLNNAHITGGYEIQYEETAGIYVNHKTTLTINLIGENTIDSGEYYSYSDVGIHYAYEVTNENNVIVITGDETASLDVTSSAEYESYGILAEAGNVLVENVTLNVTGSDTTRTSVGLHVQTANNSLIVDNAVVNATGGDVTGNGNSCASSGLGGGSIYIKNGSTVTATGGEIVCTETTTESRSSGILMIGYLDVLTGSTLNATGGDTYSENGDANSVGIYCVGQTDVREGCTINASSGCSVDTNKDTDNDCQSFGLAQALVTVNVGNNATINATSGYSDDLSAGVYIEDISTDPEYDETIVFETENGVVNANSGEVGEGGASVSIYTANAIVNGTVRNLETGEVLTYNGGIYTDSNDNFVTSATVNGGVILFGDYNLVVGGIQVTEKNKDDILGNLDGDAASAYYDPETKTLTLENADISTFHDLDGAYVGILRAGDLNINLIGENKVYVNSYEETPGTAVGIAAFGDLVITSEKSAYLEVAAGDSNGESYGLFSAPMDSDEFIFDITVSGRANVVTRSGNIAYEGNCYTAGACAFGTLNVIDSANLYGYAGEAAYSGSSSNNYGVSVGVMSYSTMNINTTGTVYGYGEKSDFVFGGIGVFNSLNVENGVVIGEAGNDVPENAIAAGLVAQSRPENVIAKTGSDDETLTENVSWYVPEADIGGVYTDENSVIGRYTVLLPVKGICGLETVTDEENGDYVVVKSVDADEGVFLAFASYDENGRMIDYKTKDASDVDEENEISVALELDGAVRVRTFVFENNTSYAPVCDYIEKVYIGITQE